MQSAARLRAGPSPPHEQQGSPLPETPAHCDGRSARLHRVYWNAPPWFLRIRLEISFNTTAAATAPRKGSRAREAPFDMSRVRLESGWRAGFLEMQEALWRFRVTRSARAIERLRLGAPQRLCCQAECIFHFRQVAQATTVGIATLPRPATARDGIREWRARHADREHRAFPVHSPRSRGPIMRASLRVVRSADFQTSRNSPPLIAADRCPARRRYWAQRAIHPAAFVPQRQRPWPRF